jgi:hypothetical protein
MFYPLIGVRLHGWLDDIVVLVFLIGIRVLELHGAAFFIALAGAAVHFALARCTRYPQGQYGLVSFRTHAFIELAEGILVLAAALLFVSPQASVARAFLAVMGGLQFGAFALSDYKWPKAEVAA